MGVLQVKLYFNNRNHVIEMKVQQSCSACGGWKMHRKLCSV